MHDGNQSQLQQVVDRCNKRLARARKKFVWYGVILIVPNIVSIIVKMVLIVQGHDDIVIHETLIVLVSVLMAIGLVCDYLYAKHKTKDDKTTALAKNIVIAISLVTAVFILLNAMRSADDIIRQREYWQFGLCILAIVNVVETCIFFVNNRKDVNTITNLNR